MPQKPQRSQGALATVGPLRTPKGSYPLLDVDVESQKAQDSSLSNSFWESQGFEPWGPRSPQAQRAIHKLLQAGPQSPASPSTRLASLSAVQPGTGRTAWGAPATNALTQLDSPSRRQEGGAAPPKYLLPEEVAAAAAAEAALSREEIPVRPNPMGLDPMTRLSSTPPTSCGSLRGMTYLSTAAAHISDSRERLQSRGGVGTPLSGAAGANLVTAHGAWSPRSSGHNSPARSPERQRDGSPLRRERVRSPGHTRSHGGGAGTEETAAVSKWGAPTLVHIGPRPASTGSAFGSTRTGSPSSGQRPTSGRHSRPVSGGGMGISAGGARPMSASSLAHSTVSALNTGPTHTLGALAVAVGDVAKMAGDALSNTKHATRRPGSGQRRPGSASSRALTPTTINDWDLLLEQNRSRMMARIDQVTTLLKLEPPKHVASTLAARSPTNAKSALHYKAVLSRPGPYSSTAVFAEAPPAALAGTAGHAPWQGSVGGGPFVSSTSLIDFESEVLPGMRRVLDAVPTGPFFDPSARTDEAAAMLGFSAPMASGSDGEDGMPGPTGVAPMLPYLGMRGMAGGSAGSRPGTGDMMSGWDHKDTADPLTPPLTVTQLASGPGAAGAPTGLQRSPSKKGGAAAAGGQVPHSSSLTRSSSNAGRGMARTGSMQRTPSLQRSLSQHGAEAAAAIGAHATVHHGPPGADIAEFAAYVGREGSQTGEADDAHSTPTGAHKHGKALGKQHAAAVGHHAAAGHVPTHGGRQVGRSTSLPAEHAQLPTAARTGRTDLQAHRTASMVERAPSPVDEEPEEEASALELGSPPAAGRAPVRAAAAYSAAGFEPSFTFAVPAAGTAGAAPQQEVEPPALAAEASVEGLVAAAPQSRSHAAHQGSAGTHQDSSHDLDLFQAASSRPGTASQPGPRSGSAGSRPGSTSLSQRAAWPPVLLDEGAWQGLAPSPVEEGEEGAEGAGMVQLGAAVHPELEEEELEEQTASTAAGAQQSHAAGRHARPGHAHASHAEHIRSDAAKSAAVHEREEGNEAAGPTAVATSAEPAMGVSMGAGAWAAAEEQSKVDAGTDAATQLFETQVVRAEGQDRDLHTTADAAVEDPAVQPTCAPHNPVHTAGISYTVVRSVVAPMPRKEEVQDALRVAELEEVSAGLADARAANQSKEAARATRALQRVAGLPVAGSVGSPPGTSSGADGVSKIRVAAAPSRAATRILPDGTAAPVPVLPSAPRSQSPPAKSSPPRARVSDGVPTKPAASPGPSTPASSTPAHSTPASTPPSDYKHKQGATAIGKDTLKNPDIKAASMKPSTKHLMIDYESILGLSKTAPVDGDEELAVAPSFDIVGSLKRNAAQKKSKDSSGKWQPQTGGAAASSAPGHAKPVKRQRAAADDEDGDGPSATHQSKKQKGPHGVSVQHGAMQAAMQHGAQAHPKTPKQPKTQQPQSETRSEYIQHAHQPGAGKQVSTMGKQQQKAFKQASFSSPHPPNQKAAAGHQPKPGAGTSKPSSGKWPFKADYNDHFETSKDACADLAPALDALAAALGKTRATLVLYDPFFCAGGVVRHWAALGFKSIVHRNRDFYADVASGQLPQYDVLVTNPPYSGDHKERAFEFCLDSGKPWALLLPNYVANKAYYAEQLTQHGCIGEDSQPQQPSKGGKGHSHQGKPEPFYIVPSQKYEYVHPEGTGHQSSPFFSIWYVHLGPHTNRAYSVCLKAATARGSGGGGDGQKPSFVRSVRGLGQLGAVPTWKRPNPKQRKKLAAAKGRG